MDDHKLQLLHSSGGCDWRTPPDLYQRLAATFPFDIDLAATAESSLVITGKREVEDTVEYAVYLGPDHPNPTLRDALAVDWCAMGQIGFLNPPYSLTLYKQGLDAGIDRADLQWLLIENWARKAFEQAEAGFTTVGVFPYAAQTQWFRRYVMGHNEPGAKNSWRGLAALDCWRIPHRVTFLRANGQPAANSNVNTCVILWGPNPGWVGPWTPTMRYWDYR